MAEHIPVLVDAVVEAFGDLPPGSIVVDGTCGLGGHSQALLERCAEIRVVAIDRDRDALAHAAVRLERFGERASLHQLRFSSWPECLAAVGVERASGLLLDIGVSSLQLDTDERGFSFRGEGPLDMRMDPSTGVSVLDYLRAAPEEEIANVLFEYGEERLSRRIARSIKKAITSNTLNTTSDLADICRAAYPRVRHRIDPATRTFQALRIKVNNEIGELEAALAAVPENVSSPGAVCVISFHSLEDRIVKQTFRDWESQELGRSLKRKPIIADEKERDANPRSRSAKLRVFLLGESSKKAKRYRSKHHD